MKIGDLVDFRLIQPVAVGVDRIAVADGIPGTTDVQPLVARIVNSDATLKAELLQSFEITKVKGKVMRLSQADRVLEIQSPYGHSMLITSGVDLSSSGLTVGDTVTIDLLDGLVVDMRRSPVKRLSFQRQDMISPKTSAPCGKVPGSPWPQGRLKW